MNDQWKQFVADAYDAFGDCAPATPVRRFLRLIEAQDAVVKAAEALRFWNPRLNENTREELAAEYDAALRALAELTLD